MLASHGSKILARVPSPTQPRPRLARVTPNCTAGRNSSRRCWILRTVRAPMRRWSINCWIRVSRTLTMANSAATKKAFAATRRTTRMILRRTRVTMASNHIPPGPSGRKRKSQCWQMFCFLFGQFPVKAIGSYGISVCFRELLSDNRRIYLVHTSKRISFMANGKKKSKRAIYILSAFAIIVVIVVGLVAATRGSTRIDPSKLAKVEKGDLAKSVVATGKIEPITKVEVKSKASGIVQKLLVDYGEKVKKDQVLAELDKEEILAQVNQQKASLQASEAAARAADADLQRAKVDAEGPDIPMLKRAYERAQRMAKDGVVSESALDDAQKNYELAINKQQLSKANVVTATSKLKQAEAQVAQARAQLAQIEREYQNSTIVSPIDGVVLSRDVEVGTAVSSILVLGSSATLVMTLGDTREVYVKGKVDESG